MTTTALPLQQHTTRKTYAAQPSCKWFETAVTEEVLGRQSPLPSKSLLLGTGDDGLPVLIDLSTGDAGSLLICSDAPAAHISLIELILGSLVSSKGRFMILSRNPWRFEKMLQGKPIHSNACLGIFDTSSTDTPDQILRLSALVNRRNRKNHINTPILLILDDANLLLSAPEDVAQNFRCLLQAGPKNNLFPVISIHANQVTSLITSGFNFALQIFGHIADRTLADEIAPELYPGRFLSGRQFAAAVDQTWLPFWAPARNSL